ncbi:MAG: hypothetical protein ACOC9T_02060 [Myxococcota bacterium]
MAEHNVVQGRRLVCGEPGGALVAESDGIRTWQFADYSWECACGHRHCSECRYESDGDTITVYHCGRLSNDG